MPWNWQDSKVVRIQNETANTRRFWLQVPNIDFKPGQFITMDLPIHEKRLQRWRSYSIASAPAESLLELCIVQSENGLGTKYLFNEVKEGSTIKFKGPAGAFTLPESLEHPVVMICTGTGIAPFRSMLIDIQKRNIPHKDIHLIFGTRSESDILYRKDFEKLLAELPNFRYTIALSREEQLPQSNTITFHKGYVHQVYLQEQDTLSADTHFYLCGWSNMIDEAVLRLRKMGFPQDQIHYELYG